MVAVPLRAAYDIAVPAFERWLGNGRSVRVSIHALCSIFVPWGEAGPFEGLPFYFLTALEEVGDVGEGVASAARRWLRFEKLDIFHLKLYVINIECRQLLVQSTIRIR